MSFAFSLPGCRWQHLTHGQLLVFQRLQLPPEQHGADPQDLQHTGRHAEGHACHQRCSDCYITMMLYLSAKMLQECVIHVSVFIKGYFLLPLSCCRGVCSCCQQVWSNHSHGNWHPVPAVRPALPLWVNTHTATLRNPVIVSVAQILWYTSAFFMDIYWQV